MRLKPSSSAMVCRMARSLASTRPSAKAACNCTSRKKRRMSRCPRLAWRNSARVSRSGSRSPLPAERLLSPHPLLAGESHPVHQAGGDPDLVLGDLTARLGNMAHDGEGGVERPPAAAGWGSLERPECPCPDRKRWPIQRPIRAPKILPSRKPKKAPSTLPQIRMVQDLVMLMRAGKQLVIQLPQPIDCAYVPPLASQQAATDPALCHPVAQQGCQLAGTARQETKAAG